MGSYLWGLHFHSASHPPEMRHGNPASFVSLHEHAVQGRRVWLAGEAGETLLLAGNRCFKLRHDHKLRLRLHI